MGECYSKYGYLPWYKQKMEQFNVNQEKICNLNIKNDSLQTTQS